MPRRSALTVILTLALACYPAFGQQSSGTSSSSFQSVQYLGEPAEGAADGSSLQKSASGPMDSNTLPQASTPQPKPPSPGSRKLGPLTISGSWRFRTEAWDWFQPSSGQNAYAFSHSLLRVGIGQKSEGVEWLLEAAQDAVLGLPDRAIAPGREGQLGLGGTYFAANANRQNNANGFLKQAYIAWKLPARGKLRLGRFAFNDGAEVVPKDGTLATLATLVNTRIAQRLIGDFGFSAVGRSFDGATLAFDAGKSNLTLMGARPTRGVFQLDANGELDADIFYGAFTLPTTYRNGTGQLRIFALGYVDERGNVLKTDNRPLSLRVSDQNHIRVGTYGADYLHVFRTAHTGQFDLVLWGVLQNGSWGTQIHRAGAFVGEFGWQPPVQPLKPWIRAGYSFGSGDANPTDSRHGTFFQVLPTPRPYARFPFYDMQNNEDFYASAAFRLPHSLALRSEVHALRLANAQDLWYGGGGAFQPGTFGYAGRANGGNRSLANVWDLSLDFPLRYGFSFTAYYAHAWGKSVIANIYPAGANAQFGYVETNVRF